MDPRSRASATVAKDEPRSVFARDLVAFVEVDASPAERAVLEELARRDREDGEPDDDA